MCLECVHLRMCVTERVCIRERVCVVQNLCVCVCVLERVSAFVATSVPVTARRRENLDVCLFILDLQVHKSKRIRC